jgi:type II secretory pathway component PulF
MNADDLVTLNEEIAGMARAGLPLDQGLAVLAHEMGRGKLARVTAALADDLRAGQTLGEALQRRGHDVPPYYAALVEAGVRSGNISKVLVTLTVYARSITNLRNIIVEALFYPTVILCFAIGLLIFLLGYVLPQFDEIFREFNMRLPAATAFALHVGRHPFLYLALPLGILLVGVLVLRTVLRSGESGRQRWARIVYSLPVIGALLRAARLATFTELLAILVDAEFPLPEAFRLAGQASADPIMGSASLEVEKELSQGRPLAEVLRNRGLVPEWVSWMTGMGERHGKLGDTLHQVASLYRRKVEMRAALLKSVLPPFVIICTAGVFVAGFVLVLMLPLFRVVEGLSK